MDLSVRGGGALIVGGALIGGGPSIVGGSLIVVDGRVDALAAAAVPQVGRLSAHGRFCRVDALELVGDPPCLRLLTTSLQMSIYNISNRDASSSL